MQITGAYDTETLSNEHCSNCHNAYTGVQTKTTTGRVEQFNKKYGSFANRIQKDIKIADVLQASA